MSFNKEKQKKNLVRFSENEEAQLNCGLLATWCGCLDTMRIKRDFSSIILSSKCSQIRSSPSHRLLKVDCGEALLSGHPVFILPCASPFSHWDWILGQRDLWSDIIQQLFLSYFKTFHKLILKTKGLSPSFAMLFS